MSQIVELLARQNFHIASASAFEIKHAKSELRRLTEEGTILRLTHGFYALVPESQRGPSTTWRPTIEGIALGVASAMYDITTAALVGPSAARALGCYPRALNTGFVAVPKQREPRATPYGNIHFTTRNISKLDTVRVTTDMGQGWATSPEQTAFDLVRNWPTLPISESARTEMLQQLSSRIDWSIIDEVAAKTRSVETLERLRLTLGDEPG
ncbi:MAG: hypothetical protein ACI81L_001142 [Verrucomicrobiales bacterium]|jgi:hypothetical protein